MSHQGGPMLDTPQMAPTTTRCTVPEAAARLGISPETVRRQIRAKRLQAHRGVRDGRSVYLVDVPTADVEPRDTARASIALVDHLQGTAVDLRSRLDSLAHEYREHPARIEDKNFINAPGRSGNSKRNKRSSWAKSEWPPTMWRKCSLASSSWVRSSAWKPCLLK